jgi:hypothetical protein
MCVKVLAVICFSVMAERMLCCLSILDRVIWSFVVNFGADVEFLCWEPHAPAQEHHAHLDTPTPHLSPHTTLTLQPLPEHTQGPSTPQVLPVTPARLPPPSLTVLEGADDAHEALVEEAEVQAYLSRIHNVSN